MTSATGHILLRALRCRPTERTPAWIMRQAGRYLPEYRALRRRAGDFLNLCKTPELAVEATLQPLRRFPLDAAIIFSDILTIPDAMGLGLRIEEGEGPRFAKPLRRDADIRALRAPHPERDLRYVLDAVQLARRELNGGVPLIGFAGSPWTLAVYMVEGGGGDFARSLKFAREQPQSMHRLLRLLAESVTEYLNAQIAHGAEVVMLFDSWGGLLGGDYEKFSLDHIATVINRLDRTVPVIVFAKGAAAHLESIAATGCDAIGVDATVDLADARRRVGNCIALQGNLAPEILLHNNAAEVEAAVRAILDSHGGGPGHIFNLAHGILPATDPEMVQKMLAAVRRLSAAPVA